MAKKQTRRSISVSRTTYEKLKAFCETNNISMSQFVETRVGDFLGEGTTTTIAPPMAQPADPGQPAPGAAAEVGDPADGEHAAARGRTGATTGADDLGCSAVRGR